MGDDVTIRLKENTWVELNKRKRPGDSFDDVIQRLLEEHDSLEEALERMDDPDSDADGDAGNPEAATAE